MYRKLLEKRQESTRRGDDSSLSNIKQYEEGNELLRSQFSELQMLTADRQEVQHYGGGQSIGTERKLPQRTSPGKAYSMRGASTTVLPKAISIPSTSAITPMPEKKLTMISSYNDNLPKNSHRPRHSGSESVLGKPHKMTTVGTRYERGMNKGKNNDKLNSTSRLSMKQANAIEITSQRQSKSISKLQNRLNNKGSGKGTEKNSKGRFAASTEDISDYVDMVDYKSRDRNVYATNLSMPGRIPKKVVMINDSAPSSPNQLQQLKMLTNVVAYEKKIKETKTSILKQKYPLHSKKTPKVDLMPALPSTYRVESNKSNTKLVGSNRKHANRLSQSPNSKGGQFVIQDGIVSKDRSQSNQTVPPVATAMNNKYLLKQHKSSMLSTSSRLRDSQSNDNSDLPADIHFQNHQMPVLNQTHQLPLKQQSKNARNAGKLKLGSPKIEMAQQKRSKRHQSNALIDQDSGLVNFQMFPTEESQMSRDENIQGAYHTQGFMHGQNRSAFDLGRNSSITEAGTSEDIVKIMAQQKQQSLMNQSVVVLNDEQRQDVKDMIDKLDLQEAIRQKAKVFFDKEQSRLAAEEFSARRLMQEAVFLNSATQQADSHAEYTQHLDVNMFRARESKIQQLVKEHQAKRKSIGADDEKELLEKVFSERLASSQSNIKRNLSRILTDQQVLQQQSDEPNLEKIDTSQEGISQLFENPPMIENHSQAKLLAALQDDSLQLPVDESITMNSNVGNSIMPFDLREVLVNNAQEFGQSSNKNDRGQHLQSTTEKSQRVSGRSDGSQHHYNYHRSLLRAKTKPGAVIESQEEHQQLGGLSLDEKTLLDVSKHYKSAQKQKKSQTMYNSRMVSPRHKLESFKKDYSQYILGQYRFGMNQHKPKSTDPEAPEALRFSQMSSHRFAETNAKFMDLYDEQLMEYRKTRRFLAKEINKSPEMKKHANQVMAESPLLHKMQKKIKLQLIKETIREEIEAMHTPSNDGGSEQRQSMGLKDIKLYNQHAKREQQLKRELCPPQDNRQTRSPRSDSSVHRMHQHKEETFEKLLFADSVASPISESVDEFYLNQISPKEGIDRQNKNAVMNNGLDINEDFASDASDDKQHHMKKATYEMDQLVTDQVFVKDPLLMGLSLYYKEHETEKKNDFMQQQKQLLNYLNILFGGNNQDSEYIAMAKNLTKQLRRFDTTESHGMERANEIFQEQTADLDIDEQDINTEIIGLLAGEILKKTQFFELLKGNTRGQQGLIQKTQMARLKRDETIKKMNFQSKLRLPVAKEPQNVDKRQQTGASFFNEIVDQKQAGSNPNAPQIIESLSRFNRLTSTFIDHRTHEDNYLKQVIKSVNQNAHLDAEMENIQDVQKEMAKASFISQCEKNMVVTLPLLLRINNKKMILERYQLNNGLCQALSFAFSSFREIANDFHLNANNLSDDDFSVILQGMCELQSVTRLSYCHNSFGHKSLYSLMPILCKSASAKNSLREIHLLHCKMSAKVTNDLLFAFNQTKNYIRSLSLVNVNLNHANYQELMTLIKSSRHLQELDISWNGLRCHQMYEIIDVLSDNRTLQDLNLSFNNFHDQMQEKFAESTPDELIKNMAAKAKIELAMKRAKTQAAKAAAEYDAMDNSMKHIMKLIRFIKMNSNLMHLNLTGMGMTTPMMYEFGRALRRTKSLVSLHLSQNNGDNENLRSYMVARGHIKQFEPNFRPDFKQAQNLEYRPSTQERQNDKKEFKLENSIIFGPKDVEDRRIAEGKSKISEQLNLKNMLKNKRGDNVKQQVENDANEMLVFTRYLGHKQEIPGSGQWRMIATSNDIQERCWVCNLEVYTLVFWSRNFGLKHQKELYRHGIDEMAYENQLYELEERNQQLGIEINFADSLENPQLYEQGHKMIGFPYIYGDHSNWKPQRMYTIEEFCYIMDKNRPNILQNLKKGNFVREEVTSRDQLNKKERTRYDENMKTLMNKYHKMKNWRKLLGINCRYKRPFLANAEALLMGSEGVNIAKMDEELAPSDSESDFGSASDSDSEKSQYDGEGDEINEEDSIVSVNVDETDIGSPNQRSQTKISHSLTQMHQKRALNMLKNKDKMNKQLYVMPCFLKPGRQMFVVQSQMYQTDIQNTQSEKLSALQMKQADERTFFPQPETGSVLETNNFDYSEQFYFHEFVAPQRRERVPLFVKQLKRKENTEAAFDRNATVFKDWKPPTDKDLMRMFDHDKELWKLPRFIKEEKHLKEVYDVFKKNLRKLFQVFITSSAGSNFPGITWLDFSKFAEMCNVVNKAHGVNQADVDRYFLASAGEMAGQGCYRYQFFEAIMRVADLKYLKSGLATSFAEAFKMFLDNNCFALGPTKEWQEFRDNTWWCYETHKILQANQRHLTKIYRSHFAPRKKFMTKLDSIDLMTKNTKIIPDENKVTYCFGMSKMHVISETTQKQSYDEMKYVEFLEFLGRCADSKYDEEEHISVKLGMLLDELFPTFGVTRILVEEEEEDMSESDPDY